MLKVENSGVCLLLKVEMVEMFKITVFSPHLEGDMSNMLIIAMFMPPLVGTRYISNAMAAQGAPGSPPIPE